MTRQTKHETSLVCQGEIPRDSRMCVGTIPRVLLVCDVVDVPGCPHPLRGGGDPVRAREEDRAGPGNEDACCVLSCAGSCLLAAA